MSDGEQQPDVVIRVRQRDDPVTAVTEGDARPARGGVPEVADRGAARPRIDLGGGRWQVDALVDDTPQQARDALAHRFREQLADTTDAELAAES